MIPRKGAIVASISPQDSSNFYELKMILEGHAARLAAKNLTENDLAKMETINRQIEAASAKKNLSRVLALHNEFHEIFLRACGNDKLRRATRGVTPLERPEEKRAGPGRFPGRSVDARGVEGFRRQKAGEDSGDHLNLIFPVYLKLMTGFPSFHRVDVG